jgi:spermidine synthase
MGHGFEELDRRSTPIGELTVRRRREPTLEIDVYEVKLGDEFLMSSLFTVAEIALATLGLAEVADPAPDVVVGGLGLGYTARAVLAGDRVRSLHVVEALDAVIEWHDDGRLPLSAALTGDPRCHFTRGDFFARLRAGEPFGPGVPDRCHAVLVDIDHAPHHLLHPDHAPFYTAAGLRLLADRLHPGGVFGLWADGAPDEVWADTVGEVFTSCDAHVVSFPNFYTGGESSSTVYVARR